MKKVSLLITKIVGNASLLFVISCVPIAAYASDDGDDAAKAVAIELARDALSKELGIDVSAIEVLNASAQTFRDSSLGCGKSGSMAAQVITPGYEVVLGTPRGNYRVHTAKNNAQGLAVVCGLVTQWGNRKNRVGLPLKNMDVITEQARNDLAKRLSIAVDDIHALPFVQAEWPDSSMDCAVSGEEVRAQPTKGYRLAFRVHGRIYTYHTDMTRVRACPAIENN